MKEIEFSTNKILVNSPFVFKVQNDEEWESVQARVISKNRNEGPVPLRKEKGFLIGELSLAVPGDYQIQVGSLRKEFRVYPNEDLSFGIEFGGLAMSVLIVLGALIRWEQIRKKKKKEAGSF